MELTGEILGYLMAFKEELDNWTSRGGEEIRWLGKSSLQQEVKCLLSSATNSQA